MIRLPSGVQIGDTLRAPTVCRVNVWRGMLYTQMSSVAPWMTTASCWPSGERRPFKNAPAGAPMGCSAPERSTQTRLLPVP
jgi:hypothetical protein